MLQTLLFDVGARQGDAWKAPSLSSLPDWSRYKRVCLDIEAKDPNLKKQGMGPGFFRRDGHVCGYGFTLERDCGGLDSFYLPVRHAGGGNVPLDQGLNYMRDNAAAFRGELLGLNLAYDEPWSATDGVRFHSSVVRRDVGLIDILINELHDRYSLQAIADRWGVEGKDDSALKEASVALGLAGKNGKDVMSNLHLMPARYVGPYGEADTKAPCLIYRKQRHYLDNCDHDLWPIVNLESAVSPVILKMQARGIRVDLDRLDQVEQWALKEEQELLAKIKHITGVDVGLNNCYNKACIAPVFQQLGVDLSVMRVRKSGAVEYNIDKYVFMQHAESPAVAALQRCRKINKLRTTFATSIRRSLVNGRIHPTYKQMASEGEGEGETKGVRFGRMSCKNPNLQQQPSRDDFAPMWRSIYIPEDGCHWYTHDYSQQEPRWTTHFAAKVNIGGKLAQRVGFNTCKGAREAAQAYWDNPKIDNHQFMADITGLPRKHAKNLFLGLCYGEGGAKLCSELGHPTAWAVRIKGMRSGPTLVGTYREARATAKKLAKEYSSEASYYETAGPEGQAVIDKFNERAPYIMQLARLCQTLAKSRGYIVDVGGRRLNFPQRRDGSYDWPHKALNRLIQGSSATQAKTAMVQIDSELPDLWMCHQEHDALEGSVSCPKQAKRAAEIMRDCVPALVPFRVDQEYGPNRGNVTEGWPADPP